MSQLRAVTFDCWGTLLSDADVSRAAARGEPARTRASEIRVDALVAHAGLDREEAFALLDRAWRTHYEAWTSGRQFGSAGMARFCAELHELAEDTAAELCAAFEEAGATGDIAALPGAVETLTALRARGTRVALVCDTGFTPGRIVRRFLQETGLADHIEVLAFSDEVGVPKPHAQMFRTALEGLGVRAEEAVHVGDLRRTDIAGARGFGMRTVRITQVYDDRPDPPLPDADEVVGSHTELLDLLTHRVGAR